MRRTLVLLIFAFLSGISLAQAQDTLDARQGRTFAQRVCAGCHGIVPGAPSAIAGAPNFYTVASTPGMTELALRVALETPHRSMPNLMLTVDEKRDVIAFIMSLRAPQ